MDFNYTKIRIGNFLYKYCFPLYNISYSKFKNENDKSEIEVLKSIVKKGENILDIGSNIGFYAKILSSITGENGIVYCFEPDRVNFKHLKNNTKGISNIVLFNNAVSDKEEVLKVYKSKLLNVDHRTYPVNNYDSIEEIAAVSIDDLLRLNRIKNINVIKIDIQGYELTAFKGMQHLLSTSNDLKIIAEYWPHGFKRAGTNALEFFDFFNELHYHFYMIDVKPYKKISREYIVEHVDKPFEFSFNVLITRE